MIRSPIARVRFAVLVAAATTATAGPPDAPASTTAIQWNFAALLDGRSIGIYRFTLEEPSGGKPGWRTLTSNARFDVKLLGIAVYRYRHKAREQWNGNCLASIAARTDDGSKVDEVRGKQNADGFALEVTHSGSNATLQDTTVKTDCLMSFAYWNPALKTQRRLLDPGSGRVETVSITPLQTTMIEVRGQPVSASGFRINGPMHSIDVWYSGDEWVGLDTVVDHGRHLSYRLQ